MNKLLGITALVATAGTAAGAGALNMLGSDTLFDITQDVLPECSAAAGITYKGTGSGNGEAAMLATATGVGTGPFATGQKIAPMSRFMNSNICAAGGAASQTATGMVVAIDGIAIPAAPGLAACNAADPGTCAPTTGGLAYSTTVSGYAFSNWKDVLAVLLAGKSHESATTIKGNNGANSGCASTLRATLANTWGSIFQTNCGGANPDGCTQLQHIFRRDDASGTSDAVASLLGLSPSPVAESNFGFGTTPYCNANGANIASLTDGATADITVVVSTAHHLTTGQQVQIVGAGVDVAHVDGNQLLNAAGTTATGDIAANGVWTVTVTDALTFTLNGSSGTGTAGLTKVGSYAMVLLPPPAGLGASGTGLADYVPTNHRDLDPVRRPCANSGAPTLNLEDVCSRDNQLGLVLPMLPTDFLNNGTTAGTEAQYPGFQGTNACTGTNLAVQTAKLVDPIQSSPGSPIFQLAQCPNGDTPHNGNQCTMPINSGAAGTACLNSASNKPLVIFNKTNTLSPSPSQILGTVYNKYLMAANKTYQLDQFNNPIVGALYRIHQNDIISGAGSTNSGGGNGTAGNPCTNKDATDQIGCLVQASPCSIGYAGRGALTASNVGLEVNQQFPDVACVLPFTYPLARKLYLDTIAGWGASSAAEQGMAKCETSESGLSPTTFSSIVTNRGFINFASGSAPNSGQPFAEDFNESMVCGAGTSGDDPAAHVNTNTFSTPTLAGMPSVGTICGNGIKEAYEDCDDGTPGATTAASWPAAAVPNGTTAGNGGAASNCSTTCRWTNAGFTGDPNGTKADTTKCGAGDNGTNCTTTAGFTPASAAGKCQNSACLAN